MTDTPEQDPPLDPQTASLVAKARWLMLISGTTTMLAIIVVLGVIGYRLFRGEGSVAAAGHTAMLPKGARITATAVAGDRLVITVDAGGRIEIHTFNADTLRPAGILKFAAEP